MRNHTTRTIVGRVAGALALAAVLAFTASPAQAEQEATTVSAFSGGIVSSVPIAVPPFRNLEPKVRIGYGSQSGNGFVGVGWAVAGPSYIERTSVGRGAPAYTTADVYALDGNELVASPLLGGTHCTKVQSYDRITFDSIANKWYVTNREGVKSTYSAVYTTALGTFRWGLTEVRDPKNSYATYSWSCVGAPHQECYLNTITYNGNTVTFYKEARTDIITYGNGYTMGSMGYRLRSIAVKVGASLVRVYKLGYTYSSITQRSILTSVQQCGKDAVVDTAGAVTGGTCLPAMSLSGHSGGSALALGWGNPNMGQTSTAIDWLTGDQNGDGKSDIVQAYASGSTMAFKFYNSTGCGYAYDSAYVSANTSAKVALLSGDVTGDGKANIVHAWNNGGNLAIALYGAGGAGTCYQTCYATCYDSYGYPYSCDPYACNPYACSATYGQIWSTTNVGQTATAEKFFLADVTGDGKADLVQATRSSNTVGFKIYKSNGTSFSYLWGSTSLATPGTFQQFYAGDVNGDGKADMIESYAGGIAWFQSTGSAFTYKGVSSTGTLPAPLVRYAADMNGDGKTDIFQVESTSSYLSMRVYVSNGRTFNLGYSTTSLGYLAANLSLIPADVNGDGRTDLVQVYEATSYRVGFRTFTSRGTSYAYASGTTNAGQGTQNALTWLAPDYNGDGKSDIVLAWDNAGSLGLAAFKTANSFPDLVGTINNGLGGVTTVTYAPSSEWPDNELAEGMVFSTVKAISNSDGRGDTQATNYTYSKAKFDIPSREFLGFRKAVTTLAATGAYSETYYWQRIGTIAKPEVIYKRKANGSIISFEKFTFSENASPPYTSNVTTIWVYQCNGNGVVDSNNNYVSGCQRIYSTYDWDTYGNLTQEKQYGNYDLSGDERTAYRSFVPNNTTTTYITNSPAYENMYQGIGTAGCGRPDCLLARTRFFYDGAAAETTAPTEGKLTKKGVWDSQTGNYIEHSFGYDAYGNETSITDPLLRTSTKVYDSTYHVYTTSTTNALGHATTNTWDYVLGLPTITKDADLNPTTHAYDALGRATLTTQSSGRQIKIEYLNWGSPTAQKIRTSFLMPGSTWIWEDSYQDGLGREYQRISQSGVMDQTIYGATGKVWQKSVPYISGETVRYDVYTYDEVGRELTMTRADGKVSSRSYDDGITATTDPTGNKRTAYWDAWNRLTKVNEVISGVNKVTSFYYDVLGRRTKSVGPEGHVTTAVYDSLGRIMSKSDPDQGAYVFTHNKLGQVVTEKDALGKTTTLSYDSLGRVTKRAYADGMWDRFAFDETGRGSAKGRLTTAISRCSAANQTTCTIDATNSVTTTAYYDNMGRRTKFSQQIGTGTARSISHSYDTAGRVASIVYPDGETVGYTYGTSGTALGRLTGMTGSVAGALLTNVVYTARGMMASMTMGNGVTTTFNRDAYGENTTSVQVGSLATMTYGYDSVGRLTSFSSPQLLDWTYGYDTIGRLTRATNTDSTNTQTFTYDAAGRMKTNSKVGTYTYGLAAHPHAVTAAGSNTYAYDANGNMTSGAGRTYTYYQDHRPATITSGGLTTSFLYDAQGLRVKKSSTQQTVEYVGAVYELRGAAVTKYYMAGGLRVAKRDVNGNSFFHADHLGSVRLITNATGGEVKRYEYAPFGAVVAETGTRPDSHRFTGQEADDETGLMFFQARYYDPALGRFVQPDPIVPDANAPQSLDLYQYANNAPVNYVDPSGHAPLVAMVVAFVVAHAVAIACIIIGTALTFTNNPFLQTIGMILAGVASAGMGTALVGLGGSINATMWVAGAVALAQSPISPLDPTIKKAIGWAYTVWGGVTSIQNKAASYAAKAGVEKATLGMYVKAVATLALKDAVFTAGALGVAYLVSKGSIGCRLAFAFIAKAAMFWSNANPGPMAMVGMTYDLVYTLKYPDGRVIDLSGGEGGEMFTFYYHTGFESTSAYGRQHIRVGDSQGGYWELGDARAGWFGPGLGWAGWVTTQKVTVIMSPTQAAAFRQALTVGAQSTGGYVGLHRDSYTYISSALEFATGKSAADLHINPGLIHW